MRIPILALLIAALSSANAEAQDEARQLGAHMHGESRLNIAIEGRQVSMDLEAPAMDIVGFEYEPSTDEDRTAIETAKATLSRPLELFALPAAAGCVITDMSVAHVFGDEHHDEGHHDDGDEADAADKHEDGEHEAKHSEFQAYYKLSCTGQGGIDAIDFRFFAVFPNAEAVEVQAISDSGQAAYEVKRDAPRLLLEGLW